METEITSVAIQRLTRHQQGRAERLRQYGIVVRVQAWAAGRGGEAGVSAPGRDSQHAIAKPPAPVASKSPTCVPSLSVL